MEALARGLEHAIARFLSEGRSEMRLAAGTLEKYGCTLRQYRSHLLGSGIGDWSLVSEPHVRGFLGATAIAPATLRSRRSALRVFHRWMLEAGLADSDPTTRIRAPRVRESLPETLTELEITRLLEHATSVRDLALLSCLYSTGCRAGELLACDLRDFTGTALRLRGKGHRDRLGLLAPAAAEALARYLTDRGELAGPLFFGNRPGVRLTPMGLWLVIQKAAKGAGLTSHVSAHTLRHSFATHLLQCGADLRSVQLLLGHSRLETTATYLRLSDRWVADTHARFHPLSGEGQCQGPGAASGRGATGK